MANFWRVGGLVAIGFAIGATAVEASAQVAPAPISPAVHATASTPLTLLEMNVQAAPAAAVPALASTALRARPDRAGESIAPGVILASASLPVSSPLGAAPLGMARPGRSLDDLVAENASANTPDEQFECLARTVYFESRGEPIEGQLAVAEVVLNRTRSDLYRGTICDVVRQRAQFSFVRGGVIPDVPRDSAAWRRSVGVAHVAMQSLASVTGRDSLFFHATYVRPSWGRVRPRIAQIGNHIFFR